MKEHKSEKKRLDILLLERELFTSREKARAAIMGGLIYVNGQREDKAGSAFPDDENTRIEVRGRALPYVSRGGLKLEKALNEFEIELDGSVCTDIGASTGGFTDCMLTRGAKKVFAIDVGYGQLDWKLRNDQRVVCMEKTNMRYVKPEDIGRKLLDVLVEAKVFESKGAGRRLIAQNGVSIGDDKWTDTERVITAEDIEGEGMLVRKGKKKFYRLIKG